jgi:hypothetical protein
MTTTAPAAAPLTDAEIIAHHRAQTLLRELRPPLDTNQQEALHVQLATLHNAGSIDMLALTATPEFLSLDRPHFFTIQVLCTRRNWTNIMNWKGVKMKHIGKENMICG